MSCVLLLFLSGVVSPTPGPALVFRDGVALSFVVLNDFGQGGAEQAEFTGRMEAVVEVDLLFRGGGDIEEGVEELVNGDSLEEVEAMLFEFFEIRWRRWCESSAFARRSGAG